MWIAQASGGNSWYEKNKELRMLKIYYVINASFHVY